MLGSGMEILEKCPLFAGISVEDIPTMLGCLGAKARHFKRGEAVFSAGQQITAVGVVLRGSVHVEQDDYWGNRAILARAGPGELFGEAFAYANTIHLPVGVHAAKDAEILLIDTKKMVSGCSSACAFHGQLVQNMLHILAVKNVALTQKMEVIAQRTTRDKLLFYLSQQAKNAGANRFTIPFNRQELADYLAVDRSAMSSTLSKMQRDGLIQYEKNIFELV